MSTDFVGFDEMRQRVRKAFESAALPDAVDRLYLVRNMIGKVRISVPEKLEHDENCRNALRGLARELGGVMGAHGYLPDEADDTGVLFVSDGMLKLLGKEARPIPDLPGLPAHCTVYWAERLVTGSDWWNVRPPADTNRPARRWTLFGAKGGLGCTTTAAVLAREYARKGEQVLVVDLDLESPGLSSAMLDADTRPEFGVTDWFVEDLVGQEGAVMEKMTATPAWARDLEGGVRIAPAHGRRPREYLAKLGRVYMSSRGKDWGSRLEKMLSGLEDACSPNLVLIESRNGLHDIAAAAIAAIDADVLMFATDSDSSWENYSILFRHWREYLFRNPPDGYKEAANRLRERLHIVSAMTPSGDSYLNGFRKRSRRPFADSLYDDAPHDPLVVYWDRGFAAGASLCRFDDEVITRAYDSFLNDFEHSSGKNGASVSDGNRSARRRPLAHAPLRRRSGDPEETATGMRETATMPIAFMCHAKPQCCDALEIFKQAERLFIGWPLFAEGHDYDPRHLQTCMVNLGVDDDEWAGIVANNQNYLDNVPQFNRHRNFVRDVARDSIAVVPRPEDNAAWVARITGSYSIVDSPEWAADYLALRKRQGLGYNNDKEKKHIADVAQGWRIDRYRRVDWAQIPEALRHTLKSPGTFARFRLEGSKLKAHAALKKIIEGN